MSLNHARFYAGAWNCCEQQVQDDGSIIVRFHSTGDDTVTVLHLSDMYGPNEAVISEVVEPRAVPQHIAQRNAEGAQAWQAHVDRIASVGQVGQAGAPGGSASGHGGIPAAAPPSAPGATA